MLVHHNVVMAGARPKQTLPVEDSTSEQNSEATIYALNHEICVLRSQLNSAKLDSDVKLNKISADIRAVLYNFATFRWEEASISQQEVIKRKIHFELRSILEFVESNFETLIYCSESFVHPKCQSSFTGDTIW